MKKYVFLLIIFLPINIVLAQSNWCFLQTTPTDDPYVDQFDSFKEPFDINPAYILKYKNINAVDTIQIWNEYWNRPRYVYAYYDYDLIVMTREKKYGKNELILINTANNEIDSVSHPLCPPPYSDIEPIYRFIYTTEKKICVDCVYSNNDYYSKKRIDIYTKEEISVNDITKSIICGKDEKPIPGRTNITMRYDSTITKYRLPVVPIDIPSDMEKRPVMLFDVPINLQYDTYLIINNPDYCVIENKTPIEADTTAISIYQYATKQWMQHTIKGNDIAMHNFSWWIGGHRRFVNYDKQGYYQGEREQQDGLLYLINAKDNRYMEWKVESQDAEILQIDEDTVFFRVEDEIRYAKILETKISKPQVLLKLPQVKKIHWMYKTKE